MSKWQILPGHDVTGKTLTMLVYMPTATCIVRLRDDGRLEMPAPATCDITVRKACAELVNDWLADNEYVNGCPFDQIEHLASERGIDVAKMFMGAMAHHLNESNTTL